MTHLDLPVRDPMAALPELLRRGPSLEAMTMVTGQKGPARLLRTHFSARRPVQLVYVQGGRTVLAEFHGDLAEAEAAQLRQSLAKGRRGLKTALDVGAVVADRKAGLVLRRPGLDTRLPGLRLLHDAKAARGFIAEIETRDPGPVTAHLMAHRLGKRAVLRLTGADGRVRYARLRTDKSSSGQTAFARHRTLWEATRDTVALALPEPLGENAAQAVSLFAELPGTQPEFAGLDGYRACRAIGAATRELQALPLADLPRYEGADEARLLTDWLARLRQVFPTVADALSAAVQSVCDALTDCQGALVPSHRDLHQKQILIDLPCAGILDFDTLCLADPALDAGNLMAHLCLAGIVQNRPLIAFEAAIAFEHRHVPSRSLRLWRRAALLRLCMIYAFSDMAEAHMDALRNEALASHD